MNLRDKLKLMMLTEAKKKKEPIWCEYLESDGNQYLDTNTVANENTTVKMSFEIPAEYLAPNSYNLFFGSYEVTPGIARRFHILVADGNRLAFGYGGTSVSDTEAFTPDRKYNVSLDGLNKKIIVDNRVIASNILQGNLDTNTLTSYIFNRHSPGAFGSATKGARIYSTQIYNNNILTRNYRPCLHPDTLRPAMYDTVEGKYYYNQGTGEFKYKLGFTKLDYIHIGPEETLFETDAISPMIVYSDIKLANIKNKRGLAGADSSRRYWGRSNEGFYEVALHQMTREVGQRDIVKFEAGDINQVNKITINNETVESPENIKPNGNYFLTSTKYGTGFTETDVYGVKIEKDGLIVKDYIPIRRNDGMICFYDFVKGEYLLESNNKKVKGYLNGYQVGESIKADGGQYIDTGVNAHYKRTYTYAYMNCESPSKETVGMFGSRVNYGQECTNAFCVATGYTFTLRLDMLHPNIVTPAIGENRLVECVLNGEKAVIDGETYTTTEKPDRLAPFTDYIFNINRDNKAEVTGFTGRCYTWFVITDNVLQLNLIPVKKDSFIGMIDTLTGKEYPNMGTGSFIFHE